MLNACYATPNAGVKADYLVKFANYVTWPTASGPITICVIGSDPLGSKLDKAIRKKVTGRNNRKLQAKRLNSGASPNGCEILYISPKLSSGKTKSIINRAGKGVLTVGDRSGFIAQGGIVEFCRGKRVHFKVNNKAARKAGLKISSQLLKLAKRCK